jgi:hypothetical protein
MMLAGCVAATPPVSTPTPAPTPSVDETHAELIGQLVAQVVRQQLDADLDQVRVTHVEPAEWPDGCLGLAVDGETCAQVVTPGYRVELETPGGHIVYHADAAGDELRLAEAPPVEVPGASVFWTGELLGQCRSAMFGPDVVAVGPCGGPKIGGRYAAQERADGFVHYVGRYAPFEAETAAGQVAFSGGGTVEADPGVQRMVAEWARLAALEAWSGGSDAGGLALAWQREGGIAGFCDDLTVTVTGDVAAATCLTDPPETLGHAFLTDEQAVQLFKWVDRLQDFEWAFTDDAVADAMTTRIVFSGAGEAEASQAEIDAINVFAAERFAEVERAAWSGSPAQPG